MSKIVLKGKEPLLVSFVKLKNYVGDYVDGESFIDLNPKDLPKQKFKQTTLDKKDFNGKVDSFIIDQSGEDDNSTLENVVEEACRHLAEGCPEKFALIYNNFLDLMLKKEKKPISNSSRRYISPEKMENDVKLMRKRVAGIDHKDNEVV